MVYLTNSMFEHDADPSALATQVWEKFQSVSTAAGFSFREIQSDCDWSDGTREAYFEFCRSLRALAASSGVRLGERK